MKEYLVKLEEVKKKVVEFRKKSGLELRGVASSNVRRQLLRLRSVFIIEKIAKRPRRRPAAREWSNQSQPLLP